MDGRVDMSERAEARVIVTVLHMDDRMISNSEEVATITCPPKRAAVIDLTQTLAAALRQLLARDVLEAGGKVLVRGEER